MADKPIRFATVGIDHVHAYHQNRNLLAAGYELVAFWATDDEQAQKFTTEFPQARRVKQAREIYEDPTIELVNCAAIPGDRAAIGVEVLRHDKDFLVDKPGVTSFAQLNEVMRVQRETNRKYLIWFSERLSDRATVKASELVKAGAIGRVVQTIGFGPHQISVNKRPDWFYRKARYGGILIDIASHQIDQFLHFTGSTRGRVVSAQIANYKHPQYPELEDFGDVVLQGDQGMGYARLDWLTPAGLGTWGDGRIFVLGTEGTIEIRKQLDLGGRPGKDHVYLVAKKGPSYIACADVQLPFATQLAGDIRNRTETALTQAHCFLVAELGLEADRIATRLGHLAAA